MDELETVTRPTDRLVELAGRLVQHRGFSDVVRSLQEGQGATVDGAWGSSRALLAAALASHASGPLVVVCPHAGEIDDFCHDLALFTSARVAQFPAWESEPGERILHDDIYGDRLRLLKLLGGTELPELVITSIQSLLQPVPDREMFRAQTRQLSVGDTIAAAEFSRWLVERGFHHTSAVELPGEFALRGGIIDVFAPDWYDPVRIELFGDEVESIRRFEVSSQRSLMPLESVEITVLEPGAHNREHLGAYLPEGSWFLLIEPRDLEEQGRNYLRRIERVQDFHSVAAAMQAVGAFATVTAEGIASGSLETSCHLQIESVERFSGDIGKVRAELEAIGEGHEVFVVCETEAEATRLGEIFGQSALASEGRLHLPVGRMQRGFCLVPERMVLVSGAELFHRTDLLRPSRRRLGRTIDSFLELREGDLVVHLAHGVGRYRGMKLLEKAGQAEEHLALEFHGGTRIYVPASKIELVQKYVGGSKARPSLARVGGKGWVRQKQAAQLAVTDLAAEMIELEAVRATRPGIAFPVGTVWQQEFDASFPYQETPDQLASLEAIQRDMRQPRPMDRLLCGDVGFGKTELAIRAAFRAVDAGYQVAVLVPTTVLAEQHTRTFRSRMAEFPFEIATLSRFSTKKEQGEVIKRLAAGTVDIVVGTHRLAQRDVAFHNLGLVIIDEEQRFGVQVKDRLRSLRETVDVLTMTATPIPRTLHLSLLGVRDISNLETPPDDRHAIETRVTRFDPAMIRHAILRELNRDGQVYFVHNRVHDIERVAAKLAEIVPEAAIEIGHGQMPDGQLEEVMLRFIDRQYDVLLATTIIESGLDIPNANTIFIDDADRYGLADLHQLRGRVGRYKHRAYCYLLVDPKKSLSPEAARRLRAIEEFSEMGAGFAIAMRDLELRGAGNILGTQQSGHIAAVGYELYCSLLEVAIRRQKALPPKESIDVAVDLPIEAYLPDNYVPDMRVKIDLYRRLARIARTEDLDELTAELADRFGPRPAVVEALISLFELRISAHHWGIRSIHIEDQYVVMQYTARHRIECLQKNTGGRLRVVDERSAYLPLAEGVGEREQVLPWLKSVLRPL